MTIQEIISAIGLIGLGGLLKGLLDFFIADKKRKSETKHQFKETRYKAIILLCYTYVNFEREGTTIIVQRPDIDSKERLYNELNAEWINMILYASDKVLLSMKNFLESGKESEFNELIISMRKDLYGIKTKISMRNLKLLTKPD
ncbi:MAG: hypothetical protein GKR88_18450 [Flavobacteriaceae bacterium]|nr:MAG: hypothetical protein GKR88_18450 [Flavobacteriaceae bacterium]